MISDLELSATAHRVVVARTLTIASAPSARTRRGHGWLAFRTGASSNDLNGVVSVAAAGISADLADELWSWVTSGGTPASWLISGGHDPGLTEILLRLGARPERDGWWSGGPILTDHARESSAVEIVPVTTESRLDAWLTVAEECDWFDGDSDRGARRELYESLGLRASPLQHWLALEPNGIGGGRPVGFATSFLNDTVLELTALGVRTSHRRRGFGTALVRARCAAGRAAGASMIISEPSHDGWQLQRALGLRAVPVQADLCFYLDDRAHHSDNVR